MDHRLLFRHLFIPKGSRALAPVCLLTARRTALVRVLSLTVEKTLSRHWTDAGQTPDKHSTDTGCLEMLITAMLHLSWWPCLVQASRAPEIVTRRSYITGFAGMPGRQHRPGSGRISRIRINDPPRTSRSVRCSNSPQTPSPAPAPAPNTKHHQSPLPPHPRE